MKNKQKGRKLKKVNMYVVEELKRYRKIQNYLFKDSELICSLNPKNSGLCKSCPYLKECKHYKWERDYIHRNEQAEITSKRRKKQQDFCNENINVQDEKYYPCYPFDFACPKKETCNGNCMYI